MYQKVAILGREQLELKLEVNDGNQIISSDLKGIGGPEFIYQLQVWREKLSGSLSELELPTGNSIFALMFREAFLKMTNQWNLPFEEEELCHCRAIPLEKVEAAISVGAHTPEKVSRWTSASTACGTCRPDVEAILKYRLK